MADDKDLLSLRRATAAAPASPGGSTSSPRVAPPAASRCVIASRVLLVLA
jgi:hypothetical protein